MDRDAGLCSCAAWGFDVGHTVLGSRAIKRNVRRTGGPDGGRSVRKGAGSRTAKFDSFVRPVVEPKLSQFCTALTTIKQADVDGADMFPAVFARFLEWIGDGPYRLCSWGFFDVGQFRLDCTRFGLVFPEQFESEHLNIKQVFADWKGVRRCGMTAALDLLGLPLAGTHHRGIDDARNIARIVQLTLPNAVVS